MTRTDRTRAAAYLERPLDALLAEAAALRDRSFGRAVTWSPKVFIPLVRSCRNRCGYCSFRREAGHPEARFLRPEEVMAIVREGERRGCLEALVTLGERPEAADPGAREELRRLGHENTISYVAATCRMILSATRLLPHVNAGALREDEMRLLRPYAASMGTMLESVSERLSQPGAAHGASPDKAPARRLETLDAAARLRVPFTTGILAGIGETWEERIASLEAIAARAGAGGAIQEVIVQNFRPKSGMALPYAAEPGLEEMLRTIAAARLILPPEVSLQAPPNLMPGTYGRYLDAGLSDWGGISPVTRDEVNPEHAWPEIDRLRAETETRGFSLRPRLTVYPRYALADEWTEEPVRSRVRALADETGWPRAVKAA